MSDDLTAAGVDGICRSYDEHYDTVKEVVADPYGAWDAIQIQADRIEELEDKLANLAHAVWTEHKDWEGERKYALRQILKWIMGETT
jgi:23S rRNA G2069 N7-methylase RlmK/C1962 C5-methylase RlmI